MYEWTFSATAEWVVGALLLVVLVATLFVSRHAPRGTDVLPYFPDTGVSAAAT
jgi:hypothetical protein